MSQLPTSPFPKRGTSGPGNVFSTLLKQTGEGDIYGATGVLRESPKCSNCEHELCIVRR